MRVCSCLLNTSFHVVCFEQIGYILERRVFPLSRRKQPGFQTRAGRLIRRDSGFAYKPVERSIGQYPAVLCCCDSQFLVWRLVVGLLSVLLATLAVDVLLWCHAHSTTPSVERCLTWQSLYSGSSSSPLPSAARDHAEEIARKSCYEMERRLQIELWIQTDEFRIHVIV